MILGLFTYNDENRERTYQHILILLFQIGGKMLGGSFWIALLRNGMGAILMMAVFLLLDRPKLSMKKTLCCYTIFVAVVVVIFSLWYLYSFEYYVRFSGMLAIFVVGFFCILLSGDTIYLSLYKLTLGFYLLSLTVFCGVDFARIFFSEDMWADIIIRFVMEVVILYVIARKVRKNFLEGIDYLWEELDWFSTVTVVMSIFISALVAFWPGRHAFSMFHVVRTIILFFMAGIIQYMVYQLYLHRGRERRFQVEKELLEMNERLLQRQLELMQESKEETARVRHDLRHHCLLMEEYIRNREQDKLYAYVKQYREDIERLPTENICGNETINSIMSVYVRWAREKAITVNAYVDIKGEIAVRDIDLVAVIANVFENAIHGCLASGKQEPEINISLLRKKKKMVFQCRNTCGMDVKLVGGIPQSSTGIGISSVLKIVSYYNGEAEFAVEEGQFIVKILLNIPENS